MGTRSQPKVSVIVPIYKVEKYLPQCIESLLGQTLRDIEIILVDDGSPDGSPRLCEEAAARDARVKVIHKKNDGLLEARKSGAAVAAGTYIGFVDGDDWVAADYFERLYGMAAHEDADVVCAGFCMVYEDGRTETVNEKEIPAGVYDRQAMEKIIFPRLVYAENKYQIIHSAWSKLYKREIFCRYGLSVPKELGKWEDFGFTRAAVLCSRRVAFLDYASGYYYRQLDNSMSHGYQLGWYSNVKAAHDFVQDAAAKESLLPMIQPQLARMMHYTGGMRCLEAETDPSSPLHWKEVYALCQKIFSQPEGFDLIAAPVYMTQKVLNLLCRTKNAALAATGILILKKVQRIKLRSAARKG